MTFTEPRGPAGYDTRTVLGIVNGNQSTFVRCYTAGLSRSPRLAGVIRIDFVISSQGQVTHSSVAENVASPDVGTCFARIVSQLNLPRARNGQAVRLSITSTLSPN